MQALGSAGRCGMVSGAPRAGGRRPAGLAVRASGGPAADAHGSAAVPVSRRQVEALLLATLTAALTVPGEAQALGFKKELKKKKIPIEDYTDLPNGLKVFDLVEGRGEAVATGTRVVVHYDCMYRGIDVVSSRQARLLGGNRTIAEPFEFVAGGKLDSSRVRVDADSAGGLFSGASGPKPPPALSTAVVGMKLGGKRSVMVPPELGYGAVGEQEIGPNTPLFELKIELLSVEP